MSGINTNQIVQALLAQQEQPILQLETQQANEQAKQIAWQDINTKLSKLQEAASTLGLQSTVNAKTVTFGASGAATGVVKPTASLGNFTLQIDQLATSTVVNSSNAIVSSDVATSSAKLSTPVTAGTFSIDGVAITVTSGETIGQILADINTQTTAAAGSIVSGTIVNNEIQLTSNDASPITIGAGGDTSNFLSVMNLTGQGGASTATSSLAVGTGSASIGKAIASTDIPMISSKLPTKITAGTFSVNGNTVTITQGDSFGTILANISTATGGAVTGTVTNNGITLTSASNIQLGSGGDSSNFLSVVHLLGLPSSTSMSSSSPVGVVTPSVALDSANISGLTSVTQGSFSINGVSISYNSATDTLNDVLARINASAAGVSATYDPRGDKVLLTAAKTGNIDISTADGSGNLLARLGLTDTNSHVLGQSAKYEVNGGPAQYSLTNNVSDLVPGVNVTFAATTSSATTASVTQDNTVGTKAIQDFVTAYNDLADLIKTDTAYDTQTKVAGIFLGDPTVGAIQQALDSSLFISNGKAKGLTPPYTDISVIGLNTGDVGSAPGTTNDLKFDATQFADSLAANSSAVTSLVNSIFGSMSKQILNITQPFGLVDSAIKSQNTAIIDLQHQIDDQLLLLQAQQQFLTQEFTGLDSQLSTLQAQSSQGAAVLSALSGNQASSSSSGTSA